MLCEGGENYQGRKDGITWFKGIQTLAYSLYLHISFDMTHFSTNQVMSTSHMAQ